ncbi:pleckstrin-like protein [Hysterangium stoloniferum]|nr:pleckstrin-like protein [Hysterangium stoloniferum]
MSSKPSVPPPSPQEIHRKLSVHAKPKQKMAVSPGALSGTESDSDSQHVSPEMTPQHVHGSGGASLYTSNSQPPLQSIAERVVASGDESDEDEDEDDWRKADKNKENQGKEEETIVKSGYLWKKGSRRKTWKKRWFVLRSPHLAYYKTSAEYQLLRLLDLNEIHSVTPVTLKKHTNTFGLVLPTRTLYLQAESQSDVASWVRMLNEVRERLQSTASITPAPTPPVAIPAPGSIPGTSMMSPSPPHHAITSSDEDEYSAHPLLSPGTAKALSLANDPTKIILSGYLMKCGKRKSWRKRWFVLTGEKLTYCGNHMDNKHQRQIPLAQILDAMESALPSQRGNVPQTPSSITTPPVHTSTDDRGEPYGQNHTFKIVTTKRSILLCAPSEEEEIRWLSAVRALIARRSGGSTTAGKSLGSESGAASIGGGTSGSGSGSNMLRGGGSRITGGLGTAVEGVVGA